MKINPFDTTSGQICINSIQVILCFHTLDYTKKKLFYISTI